MISVFSIVFTDKNTVGPILPHYITPLIAAQGPHYTYHSYVYSKLSAGNFRFSKGCRLPKVIFISNPFPGRVSSGARLPMQKSGTGTCSMYEHKDLDSENASSLVLSKCVKLE